MIDTSAPLLKPALLRLRALAWAVLAGAWLAGCAASPDPARLPHSAAESALRPPDLTLPMEDGLNIPVRLYRPTGPVRAVVLGLHGYGDSRDAWEFLAPQLNADGILVAAPDIRGFGGARVPGGWSTTARMLRDTAAELRWAETRWPGVPVYVMGESMGGALAFLLTTRLHELGVDPPRGVILLAPAVFRLGQPARALLGAWNLLTPAMVLNPDYAPGERVASTNYRALRRLYFDPLSTRDSTVHSLHGLVALMAEANGAAAELQAAQRGLGVPVLMVWGSRDQLVPPEDTAAFVDHLAPPGAAEAPGALRLDEIDGAYHLLSRERTRVGADIAAWIFHSERFLPSGGDLAAAAWRAAR
ncbi:alpha/beta hydrolase [Oecophyllibacter saccharovorans]|uniref:Alpha/beta fold hydrolase n=1 Tax=Oecophyllibacter saccharovorans TaxID=2558360 RepID=A0A506UM62_9PROT|nr:alpha/beta fold hydrolase [Oecophyllibacter saccharovorans]TPW34436.1 alpha/beta fold hydrolase [Oecophyllibacter saccharovorans]